MYFILFSDMLIDNFSDFCGIYLFDHGQLAGERG